MATIDIDITWAANFALTCWPFPAVKANGNACKEVKIISDNALVKATPNKATVQKVENC